jgi:hypothetical protein
VETEFLQELGLADVSELENYVLNNPSQFAQKHTDYVNKIRSEQPVANPQFEHLADDKKVELEKVGVKYDEVVKYAEEVGATKITDRLITSFKNEHLPTRQVIPQSSVTSQAQQGAVAGKVETGGRPEMGEPESCGEKAVKNLKYVR